MKFLNFYLYLQRDDKKLNRVEKIKDVPILYNLALANCWPEKRFIKDYGKELFEHLRQKSFAMDAGKCAGCGHEPPEEKKKDCLFFHVYEVNQQNPELSKGITLCKMCHLTQHIEYAAKHNWISFVNSIYSQNNIIRLIRFGQTYEPVRQRNIVTLKKNPEQFLKELYSGELRITPTLKVLFTTKFNIDDR